MKHTWLVTVLVLGMTAFVAAQPADGGEKPARPERLGPPGERIKAILDQLPETLALTDEQKAKVAPIIDEFNKGREELAGSLKDKLAAARNAVQIAAKANRENPSDENAKVLSDARAALAEAGKPLVDLFGKLRGDLKSILDEAQNAKLAELLRPRRGGDRPGGEGPGGLPGRGPGMFLRRALDGLELTDEQKDKIKALREELAKQIAALREGGGHPDRQKMRQLITDFIAKVKEVLTDEQKKLLEEKLSAPREGRRHRKGGDDHGPGRPDPPVPVPAPVPAPDGEGA
jgi:Spy/CpxP family protein refolding chaperone